ncbi:MAG: hypothetical protein SOT68_10925 [Oscillospiraceae bacterium]|nr:hypothetical protein [Oscillospiraceae bacterium]MCI7500204.1 hypothetical protein [Oscillospiraceae bacterium]MDD7278334.1 hypothetical protein [Oscillospiraceae bacterium]MDY2864685.1 hypothetical protein [Oscillospiraceae bacterium]
MDRFSDTGSIPVISTNSKLCHLIPLRYLVGVCQRVCRISLRQALFLFHK